MVSYIQCIVVIFSFHDSLSSFAWTPSQQGPPHPFFPAFLLLPFTRFICMRLGGWVFISGSLSNSRWLRHRRKCRLLPQQLLTAKNSRLEGGGLISLSPFQGRMLRLPSCAGNYSCCPHVRAMSCPKECFTIALPFLWLLLLPPPPPTVVEINY